MKKKFYYFLLFSLLPHFTLFGFQKDSLLMTWQDSSQVDSIRFQAFYDLIFSKYMFTNPDTALLLSRELLDQASLKEDLFWEGKALNSLGTCYSVQSACDQALVHYQQSLEKYEMGGYRIPQAEIYNNIGLCHHFSGDYVRATSNYQKGMAIVEEYQLEGRTKLASLGNLSKIYEDIGDYELASHYLQQIMTLGDDPAITANAYHSLGSIYSKQADYDNAEKYLTLAIEQGKLIQNRIILAFTYLDLGKLKLTMGSFPAAEAALREAEQLFQKLGNKQYLASTYAQMGILFHQLQQYRQGLEWCNKATKLLADKDFLAAKEEVCRCAYLNHSGLHNYEAALRNHVLLTELQDTLLDEKKIRTLAKMEMQNAFDLEKTQMEAKQMEALLEAELKQSRTVSRFSGALVVLLWLTLIGSIVLFYFYRKRTEEHNQALQENNLALTEKNKELERFAFITSHDLKEPVRNISAFSDLLRKHIDKPQREEYLDFIKSSATKMYNLIESIMAFTKVNNKAEQQEKVSLEEVLMSVEDNLRNKLLESGTTLSHSSLPQVWGVRHQLMIVFQNIIENAIKYNDKQHPQIEIDCLENEQGYTLTIRDNGFGISESFYQKIFEPFSRLNSGYEGSGLGLSIAKSIVEQHSGRIWVTSEKGVGSTFYFTIGKYRE